MAEQVQTTDIKSTTTVNDSGMLARAGNAIEQVRRFSNEPAVQRSIPVMITLFVIFIGIVFFLMFKESPRTTLFSSLPESEKSRVVEVLRNNGIDVSIDYFFRQSLFLVLQTLLKQTLAC